MERQQSSVVVSWREELISSNLAAKVRVTEDYVQWRNAQSAVEWTQMREITLTKLENPIQIYLSFC